MIWRVGGVFLFRLGLGGFRTGLGVLGRRVVGGDGLVWQLVRCLVMG